MHVASSPRDLPDALRGAVVAIGNFDGVHRGHRAVIGEAISLARGAGAPVGAMTFEPHPRTVFKPDNPVFRLTPQAEKRWVFSAMGLDLVVEVPFSRAFAGHSAEDFVETILKRGLGVSHVVTGYDFHFGKDRAGTPEFLISQGRKAEFGVAIVPAFDAEDGAPVSSSAIRDALTIGDIAHANGLLGYRWFVTGDIIHGEKRGRDLGYPTANMQLAPECTLRHGVYAVRMEVDDTVHNGVASYGRRPQFDNGAPLLETFLFDFESDLYGKTVAVEFLSFLRPEAKFDSVEALIAQMDQDSAEARAAAETLAGVAFGPDALCIKD